MPSDRKDRIHWTLFGDEKVMQNKERYDRWAQSYESDLEQSGYVLHLRGAELLARHLPNKQARVLDAGCGTGWVGQRLHELGYVNLLGMDYSVGMVRRCHNRDVYSAVQLVDLNAAIPLPDKSVDAVICIGALYKSQIHPEPALPEFMRVTKPGGMVVFSLRCDVPDTPPYYSALEALTASGRCRKLADSGRFHGVAKDEPDVFHVVEVYEVL